MIGQIRRPFLGLGDALDDLDSILEERAHVAFQDEPFGEKAQQGERRGELEVVGHFGSSIRQDAEAVLVMHAFKDALGHAVFKESGAMEGGDLGGELLPDAEVLCAVGGGVA